LVGVSPLAHPALYLLYSPRRASPKAISGRTSYLQVRLAYHPYPQVIPHFCNSERFGPPRGTSPASACPWVAHLVSCLLLATPRPLRTRFPYGSGCLCLNLATKSNSLAHSPKGTPSNALPKEDRPPTACKRTVSDSFHSPRRGAFHLSLTVLVRYRSTRVFSLGQWPAPLPTGLACPVVLWCLTGERSLSSTGLSPSLTRLSSALRLTPSLLTPSPG